MFNEYQFPGYQWHAYQWHDADSPDAPGGADAPDVSRTAFAHHFSF